MVHGALIRRVDGSTVCGAMTYRGMVPSSVGQRSDSLRSGRLCEAPGASQGGQGAPHRGSERGSDPSSALILLRTHSHWLFH